MLLENCSIVVTQDKERRILRDSDILIEGGVIRKVGKNIKTDEKTCEKIDCSGKIVAPAFINMHTHLPMTLLRGYRDDMDFHTWLSEVWKIEAKMKDSDYYIGSKFACLEMIKSGTSTFLDMYFGNGSIVKASNEVGLRGYIGFAMMDFGDIQKRKISIIEAKKIIGICREKKGLCQPMISPHSIYACSKDLLIEAKELAEKNGILFTIHLSETRKEVYECHKKYGKRPVEFLDGLGIIDKNFVGFHCGWVTVGEISILGKRGASVVHCPISNMKLATGAAFPYREMKEAGIVIGLGTDGAASNNSLNMLNEMKTACLMQKWFRWNALELTAQAALDMATINGAKILGLNSGSIEIGKNADILMMDKGHYSMLPGTDIISNIVYSASREAISDLMVNGEFVMQDRKVLTMNEENVKKDFENSCSSLLKYGEKKHG
jgi:5-methylthioadenosine/S-adenosylhomocysteine deaminase